MDSAEAPKAKAFLVKLLQNPALAEDSLLQREEQIIQFLMQNRNVLGPTLAADRFFPGRSWGQIIALLLTNLYEITNTQLLPQMISYLDNTLDLSFFQALDASTTELTRSKQELKKLVLGLVTNPHARRMYTGIWTAIERRLPQFYCLEAVDRKRHIHFELSKVQRLKMSREEILRYVETSMLLRPVIYYYVRAHQSLPDRRSGVIQPSFGEKLRKQLGEEWKNLPPQILSSGINANLSFKDNSYIEATARLACIFSDWGRAYRPGQTVDRGANTPEKSWLSTARKNYPVFGYDVRFLDELFMIAAEFSR
ncbi:hypothetical protein [Spirochaeta lutea]|uniref:Uncharacterized protein n=1 Tax=Spirochaeta lutea TaxID=1480694 RepID=A0A098QUZ1_9SPIO|nr:hypothetical protein [Spirochaeta lutea]KGE71346.1 hypothetical protein DC28_11075 [Spirochaeta lutea]